MKSIHPVLFALLLPLSACAGDTESPGTGADANPQGPTSDALPDDVDAGGAAGTDAASAQCADSAMTVFLNPAGGIYTQGYDNASENISSVVQMESLLTAYPYSDASWQSLMGCVRDRVSGYNIDIVDTDPGAAEHMEIVVAGGDGRAIGSIPQLGGLAPQTGDCMPLRRGIAFAFAATIGDDTEYQCEIVGQNIGILFGLEITPVCEDLMSQNYGCESKSFLDQDVECGYSAGDNQACTCGGMTQNSHQRLLTYAGPACE